MNVVHDLFFILLCSKIDKRVCVAGCDPELVESPTEPKWSSNGILFAIQLMNCFITQFPNMVKIIARISEYLFVLALGWGFPFLGYFAFKRMHSLLLWCCLYVLQLSAILSTRHVYYLVTCIAFLN